MNRAGKIGGSTVAAILGISPYSSAWAEWVRVVGLADDDDDDERFAIGRDLESGLASAFSRKTGLMIAGEQMEVVHPRHKQFVGHIDGLVFEGPADERSIDHALGIVEHKTQFGKAWDEVPPYYQAQAQFYLWVTGLERCWFSVLFSNFRHEIYEVPADRVDQRLIAWRAWRFWRDHCVPHVPPAVDGSDATTDALRELWPRHEPGTSVDVGELRDRIAEREELKARLKEIEARVDTIDNEVRLALEDVEEGRIDGERAVTYKAQVTRRVDTKRLQAERAALAEEYTYASESRVLRYRKAS